MEDATQRAALNDAHRSEIVKGEQGGRPVLSDDLVESVGDRIESGVPTDRFKSALRLRSHTLQRTENPIGRVGALLVVIQLRTERAPGNRMIARALDPLHDSIYYMGEPRTRVLAVEWAAPTHAG